MKFCLNGVARVGARLALADGKLVLQPAVKPIAQAALEKCDRRLGARLMADLEPLTRQ